MSNMSDKAQKRIVELGITEAHRARAFEHGYCEGYLEGYTEAIQHAVDTLLKDRMPEKKADMDVADPVKVQIR